MGLALDRRKFLAMLSALATRLGSGAGAQTMSAGHKVSTRTTRFRKNLVGIQIEPFAWMDEGIDKVLDILQERANVNTVYAYTYDFHGGRITKGGSTPLPDHGSYATSALKGGAFYDYDMKYFQHTTLKDFRSRDFGNFDVIGAVAPKMKERGMDFVAWDYNNASAGQMQFIPGFAAVAEIDIYGRPTSSACFNHPDYKGHLTGKIESLLSGYPSEVSGIMWGCERMGPLDNMLGGGFSRPFITCFCQFCQAKAREMDISFVRARRGYLKLDELFQAGRNGDRPADGFFVSFWRTLLEFPEILSWQSLWMSSYEETRSELYGMAKVLAPEKPFGFHIQQNITFSPFYRAADDYAKLKEYADFIKIATYNNAGGPRLSVFLEGLCSTVFADATPQELLPVYYKMMGYHEKSLDQIVSGGLSPGYLASETKRAIAGTGGQVQVYPGIDIDIPTGKGEKKTSPDDVRASVKAALGAGAPGIVLNRDYNEMQLANLSAAGEAARAFWA